MAYSNILCLPYLIFPGSLVEEMQGPYEIMQGLLMDNLLTVHRVAIGAIEEGNLRRLTVRTVLTPIIYTRIQHFPAIALLLRNIFHSYAGLLHRYSAR
jgi:hypothetical protein